MLRIIPLGKIYIQEAKIHINSEVTTRKEKKCVNEV